jgi:hypothetical protein
LFFAEFSMPAMKKGVIEVAVLREPLILMQQGERTSGRPLRRT